MLNDVKKVYDEWKKNGNFVRQYIRVLIMYMRGADIKSYSENMKMIEIIRPNVKKCYKTPTIRFVRVEEECILAGGSLDGEKDDSKKSQGDQGNPLGGAKRSAILINDDDELE